MPTMKNINLILVWKITNMRIRNKFNSHNKLSINRKNIIKVCKVNKKKETKTKMKLKLKLKIV